MPEHWSRGGSISDRISACPGCVNEAAKYPKDDTSSPAAIDGTHTHTLVEHCIKSGIYDASELQGLELTDHDGTFVVYGDRVSRANVLLSYLETKVEARWRVMSEMFVDAGAHYQIPGWGGSVDVILMSPDRRELEVIDYKDGGKPVSVKTQQLVTYGGGVLTFLESKGYVKPDIIRLGICQPKVNKDVVLDTYTHDDFRKRVDDLALPMWRSMQPEAPRSAGDHCRYCPGAKAGRCDEYNRGANTAMITAFQGVVPLDQPTQGGAQIQALPFQMPEIGADTPVETLAALIDAKPLLLSIIKEAEDEALKRAKVGFKIPGQKLVRSITQRKFVKDALEKLEAMRLKRHVYMVEKQKSPKELLECDDFKSLSDSRKAKITALIVKPEGGIVLAPESDSRHEYKPTQELFQDVPKDFSPPGLQVAPAPVQLSFL